MECSELLRNKIGLGLLVVSLMMFLGVFFGGYRIVTDLQDDRVIVEHDFTERSTAVRREGIRADTDRYLQVGYRLQFSSRSTIQKNNRWKPQFEYPYRYRVLNKSGEVLHADSGVLRWDKDSKFWVDSNTGADSGTASILVYLDKFSIQQGRELTFKANIQFYDSSYQSTLHEAGVFLYDNVVGGMRHFLHGLLVLFSFIGGVGLAGTGSYLLITSSNSSVVEESQTNPPEKSMDDTVPASTSDNLFTFVLSHLKNIGWKNYLIASALVFFGFLVVPLLVFVGHLYRVGRSIAVGRTPSPSFDRWKDLLKEGSLTVVTLAPVILTSVGLSLATDPSTLTGFRQIVLFNLGNFIVGYLFISFMLTLISTAEVSAVYGRRLLSIAFSWTCVKAFFVTIMFGILINFLGFLLGLILILTVIGMFFLPFVLVLIAVLNLYISQICLGYFHRIGSETSSDLIADETDRLHLRW
jgi:hypothetical protein